MTYNYQDHKLDYQKIIKIIDNQIANHHEEALGLKKEQLQYRKKWIEGLLSQCK